MVEITQKMIDAGFMEGNAHSYRATESYEDYLKRFVSRIYSAMLDAHIAEQCEDSLPRSITSKASIVADGNVAFAELDSKGNLTFDPDNTEKVLSSFFAMHGQDIHTNTLTHNALLHTTPDLCSLYTIWRVATGKFRYWYPKA